MTITNPSAKSQISIADLPDTGLPRDAYTSDDWFAHELDTFFAARWHYVGHVSQLSKAGDFIKFDFADYSVLVTRSRSGEISALHNVCRHRGSRLTDDAKGNCKRAFVCSYHGWSYGHDGELIGAPRMQADFDKSAFPLKRAAVDVWAGLVFVNFSESPATTVAQHLAVADLSKYRLDETKVAWDETKVLKCNWKVLWENGLECYHCAINHPEVSKVIRVERDGPLGTVLPDGDFDWTNDYPLNFESLTIDGKYGVKKFLGDPETPQPNASYVSWHSGSLEVVVLPDYVKITNYKPLDAHTTEARVIGLVNADAQEGVDYDLAHLREVSIATRSQDDALCELIQRGLNSPAYEPGPFNDTYETINRNFKRLYLDAIGR
nr:aromatic ring-hydroxylating dioxygenase subunit alpha [Rhodococcus sp. 15-1154-1]